jgi:hypothetical protein
MSGIRHLPTTVVRGLLALLIAAGALVGSPGPTQARVASTFAAISEPGPDCHPYGAPPLNLADEIRRGRLTLRPFRSVLLPADPTWRENPFRDVNWVFRYQSLRFVLPLIRKWHRTGDGWYLRRAVFLVRDWIDDNPRSRPASKAAWSDHATAWRALVLACVVQAVPGAIWARQALAVHGRLLTSSAFYRWDGNHALGQDRGLIAAGCTLGRRAWVRLATWRLSRLVVRSVDPQGVTNEQAVYYQYYNYLGYKSAADQLRRCGAPVPATLARIQKMPEFLAHATLPDGTYAMLGDTVRTRAGAIAGTPAQFAATAGGAGPRPRERFASYRAAGFAFGRTGWGERRPFRDEAMYSLRFGPGRRYHGHAEHGSLTLYAYGQQLIEDSGTFTLNPGRWRAHGVGRAAHNVVTVDGVAYRDQATAPLGRVRSGDTRDDLSILDRGHAGVAMRRRVLFSRTGGYLVVEDRLSSRTSRTYRQLWHLDAASRPVVDGRTVRTTRTRGNLRIIQLAVGPRMRVIQGRTSPIQGWVSSTLSQRRAAPVIEGVARGKTVRFLTLLVPTRGPNDPVRVTNLRLTASGWSFDLDVAGVREHVWATASDSAITRRSAVGPPRALAGASRGGPRGT